MTNHIAIDCKTVKDAELLREALRKVTGLDVADEIFAKAGPDLRTIVCFVVTTATIATISISVIIAELSALGYTDITINGKIVPLNPISLEGSINAKKNNNEHGNNER